MTNSFYSFIVFFLVFFNKLSKFLFFCQTIIFFTSNECFSHFNVQQPSTLKHKSFCFVFRSSSKNDIENESNRKNLFHSILLNFEYKVRFTMFNFFWSERLENPKINKRGGLNNSGGVGFLFKKNKRGGGGGGGGGVYSGLQSTISTFFNKVPTKKGQLLLLLPHPVNFNVKMNLCGNHFWKNVFLENLVREYFHHQSKILLFSTKKMK